MVEFEGKQMKDGQEFFFYVDDYEIQAGKAHHCENCGQLCAVDCSPVEILEIESVCSDAVFDAWPHEDGRVLCSRCHFVSRQLHKLEN